MEVTNRGVNIHLNKEKGILILSNLLEDTMVYLYNTQGDLVCKQNTKFQTVDFSIPQCGVYVLVLNHPNCQPEVRRIIYNSVT